MPPVIDGPRVNGAIRVPKVRCIDPEGNQLGVLDTREALTKAEDFGLDLVEVQPNADPPVCKILDYGKFKYEAQKRANEARKKQKTIDGLLSATNLSMQTTKETSGSRCRSRGSEQVPQNDLEPVS